MIKLYGSRLERQHISWIQPPRLKKISLGLLFEVKEVNNKRRNSKVSEEQEVLVEEEAKEEAASDNIMETVVHSEEDAIVSTKALLEAGVHFGHQTRRWNPKMGKYIYADKNGIHIINLVKSAQKIQEAYLALKKIVLDGGKVLFVGTKKQCQEIIQEEALRSGSFYVVTRWLGGTLTNFKTIQKRIKYLNKLEAMEEDGSYDVLPKKEAILLRKEKEKLLKNLDGIKSMRKIPNALFVVDPRLEHNAVSEARKLRIPVFGIVDTNCDPDLVDYVIPSNDDAVRAVRLIVGLMADAVVEAKGGQTIVAYNVNPEDEVSMEVALEQADRAEELKQIRQKAREDAQQGKKKPSRKPFKKPVEKAPKVQEEKPAEEVKEEVKPEEPVQEEVKVKKTRKKTTKEPAKEAVKEEKKEEAAAEVVADKE